MSEISSWLLKFQPKKKKKKKWHIWEKTLNQNIMREKTQKKPNPTKTWTEQKKKKRFWVDTLSAQLFGYWVQDGGLSVKIILIGKGRNFSQGRNWRGTSVQESSMVRAFIHGTMGCRIDPSWGGPIELFLVSASAPQLAVVCVILSVGWCI